MPPPIVTPLPPIVVPLCPPSPPQVEVLWVINNRVAAWEAQLPPETRDALAANRAGAARRRFRSREFRNYPYVSTLDANYDPVGVGCDMLGWGATYGCHLLCRVPYVVPGAICGAGCHVWCWLRGGWEGLEARRWVRLAPALLACGK